MRFPNLISGLSLTLVIVFSSGLFAQTTNAATALRITAEVSTKWKWSEVDRNLFLTSLQQSLGVCSAEEASVASQAALSALKNGAKVNEAVVLAVETRNGYQEALETGLEKKDARREMLQICAETAKAISKMPPKSGAPVLDIIRERFRSERAELHLSQAGKAAEQNRKDENNGQDKSRGEKRNQAHTGNIENGKDSSAGGAGTKGNKP